MLNKIFYTYTPALFLVLGIGFLIYILGFSFIWADDTDIIVYSKSNLLLEPLNGLFLPSTLDRFFGYYLPFKMDIHPSDFKSIYFKYIETFMILIFSYILTKFLYENENKTNFLTYFVFSFMFIMLIIQKEPILWLFVYDGLFRMFLSVFLLLGLLYFLSKDNNNLKEKIFITLLSFFCCITNEMTCVIANIGLFLFSFYFLLKKQFKNFAYNIIYFSSSIVGLIVSIKSDAFTRVNESKNLNLEYFKDIFDLVPEFLKDYVQYIFIQHSFELILFICLTIIWHKNNLDKKNKHFALILSFLSGTLVFFFMLIGLGKTHYVLNNFWLIHADLHMIFTIIMFAFIFLLIKTINIKKENLILNIFLISSIIITCFNFHYYNDLVQNYIKPKRIEAYKAEKIIRLANLKNKQAYIDENIVNEAYFWGFFAGVDKDKLYKEFNNNTSYINFWNQFKNKVNIGYMFSNEETVNREFKNNGGTFSEEELKNIKFNNLLSDEFLLNK